MYTLNHALDGSGSLIDSLNKFVNTPLRDYEYDFFRYSMGTLNPKLDLYGIDMDFFTGGSLSPFNYLEAIKTTLTSDSDYRQIHSALYNIFEKYDYNTSIGIQRKVNKSFQRLFDKMNKEPFFDSDSLNLFWLQVFKNMQTKYWYICNFENYKEDGTYYRRRDSLMMENVEYFRKIYPNRKIIVSTSTFHITKNLKHFNTISNDIFGGNSKPMGDYFSQNKSLIPYSITIIFSEGSVENKTQTQGTNIMPTKHKKSLEYQINKLNHHYAFVDLHDLAQAGDSIFDMYPFYFEKLKANWHHIYDGVLYIKRSEPGKVFDR